MTDALPTISELLDDERTTWFLDTLNALAISPSDPLFVHAYGVITCLQNLKSAVPVPAVEAPAIIPIPVGEPDSGVGEPSE